MSDPAQVQIPDVDAVLGARLGPIETSWTRDDVLLYHLGVGAGRRPTEPAELAYVYERGLKVLPTFATIPAVAVLPGLADVAGLGFDVARVLHGEQEVEVPGPLPVAAEATSEGRIVALEDKGSAALIVLEVDTASTAGELLARNRFSLLLRGAGGFGGPRTPREPDAPPERPATRRIAVETRPEQALLYRLTGDRNPLHADPAVARKAGFEQPILHGLCTFGAVCKALVDELLDGDVARVARYRARFAGVVLPGDTLDVDAWCEDRWCDHGAIAAQAAVRGRDGLALSGVRLQLT